ncbi:hypothetical protein DFH28DRAFT_1084580 [Melampsora americana]|nr:hypothetical protein DFH28DRAFT_1084580 [Melampsora americana]
MHIILSFAVAQLPLLAQAFLLHPHYHSSPRARLIRLTLVPSGLFLLLSFTLQWRTNVPGWMSTSVNKTFGQLLIILALRCMIWGTTSTKYYRLSPSRSPEQAPETFYNRLWFACELLYNFRGIGWSFGVPVKPKNQKNDVFLRSTVRRCLLRFMAVVFNLNKDEYPFFIDSVHKSSSLNEFWSRRWHSCLRHTLIEAAARPVYILVMFIGQNYSKGTTKEVAQSVALLSAFLMSGLVHEFGLWFATHLDWSFRTTTFFLSQGVGILVEKLVTRLTGRRAQGGVLAWTLSLIWLLFWLQPMVDAFIEHGVMNLDQMPTRTCGTWFASLGKTQAKTGKNLNNDTYIDICIG